MAINVRDKARDAIDAIYLPLMHRHDLPPYSMRGYVGPIEEFEKTPAEYIAYFKLLGGLRMDQTVLDVGCGTGRFATHLVDRPNFLSGRYEGFDIDRRSIDWATAAPIG